MRNERVRPWLGPLGVEPGVADRGVAREGVVEEEEVELGSRPVTGGFLAATVDMIEQANWWLGGWFDSDVYLSERQPRGRETKTRNGQKTR